MATYYQLTPFVPQFVDTSGEPLSAGTLEVYEAGTSTPSNLYTDDAGTATGATITLNSRGYPSVSGNTVLLYGKFDETYKFILKDSSGVTIYTMDDIDPAAGVLPEELAASTGSSLVGFLQSGTGASARTVQARLRDWVSVKDFGAVGDGVTDDTAALRACAAALTSDTTVVFPAGEYLISYTGGLSDVYGEDIFPIKDVSNIRIVGDKATIKVVDHNIAANGGLRIFVLDGAQNVEITGFKFDMSFINRNDSSSYYPQCAAILVSDSSGTAGSRTGAQLTSNVRVHGNTFELYHPLGCYAEALNSFPGDPNNGFKIYSCTFSGDNQATAMANQNAGFDFSDNVFTAAHNGYGVWVWAVSAVSVTNNKALSWANYASDSSGVTNGSFIPMIRYHQWHNSGLVVSGNIMISRPLASRTGGLQGMAHFCHTITNLTGDYEHGDTIVANNIATLSTNDALLTVNLYGTLNVSGNIVHGDAVGSRPSGCIIISMGQGGKSYVHIQNNSTDINFSAELVSIDNCAPSAADRRMKTLTIKNNQSLNALGLGVIFTNIGSLTTCGVEHLYVENNLFDGENSEASPANTNNAAVNYQSCTEAGDVFFITRNIVRHYYNFEKGGTATVYSEGNDGDNVTASTEWNYLPIRVQTSVSNSVAAGVAPLVGSSNSELFRYTAERRDTTTGLVLEQDAGVIAGGSTIGVATPAGSAWYIYESCIATKRGTQTPT